MTRINLVPVEELMDQHLFAEFREIKMVPKSLRRSIHAAYMRQLKKHGDAESAKREAYAIVLSKVPDAFTLNTGHVSFFYDKYAYLVVRYKKLKQELSARGINANFDSPLDPDGTFDSLPMKFHQHYEPTEPALQLVRDRIAEKIALRPNWYRYKGEIICSIKAS